MMETFPSDRAQGDSDVGGARAHEETCMNKWGFAFWGGAVLLVPTFLYLTVQRPACLLMFCRSSNS